MGTTGVTARVCESVGLNLEERERTLPDKQEAKWGESNH